MTTLRDKLYINGKWVAPARGQTLPVIDPSTEEVFHHVASATQEDVDLAVEAARTAFVNENGWSSWSGKMRAVYLRKISDKLKEKKDFLGKIETKDCGKPLREALWDMDDVAGCFAYYADLAEKLDERQNTVVEVPDNKFKTVIQYLPVGVVAAIIPWNYPLLMAAWKVAPALAAGCTIILKPSENTSLTALELAAIADEIGLPVGVLNVITGYGPSAGEPLTKHVAVDKIAFTGSVPTGSRIMHAAADEIKKISLELGGKSPIIVFDDVDIKEAVEWVMFGCFWTNGQICSATSRLLVHESIASKLFSRLKEETEKINVVEPTSELDPIIGPVVSKAQYDKVMGYIAKGKAEGATVLCGGKRPINKPKGYYIEPTIFTSVNPGMTIWREEIFGPVLSVMTFKTEKEAIQLANDSNFGLGAAVISKDTQRCQRIAKQFRAGIVWINCSQPCFIQGPWGGLKKSGIGRELGTWGLDSFLEVKQITEYTSTDPWGWYIKSKI